MWEERAVSQQQDEKSDVPAFLRGVAERCRFRSKNCFDLVAAVELRTFADELDSKAARLEMPAQIQHALQSNGRQSPE
jgi:hypothetical protein